MNNLDRADAYLTIPQSYSDSLGIRWSKGRDAIERRNETVFAFSEELLSILDGIFANPPAPHFAFVLSLLDAMKRDGRPEFAKLHHAFEATRGGVGRRNVGLLIAELCRELPSTVGDLSASDIANAVQWLRLYGEHTRTTQAQEPPLTRDEFQQRIAARLARYSEDDLKQWLTHGTGPSHAGEQLAAQTESLPARVARLLALAKKRQRLVGAAVLVPAIDAGLTLPPRRRSPNAPPQGGYCDVTNRGEPEQLLPTQFALEPDEFIRRFASRELLYFQKEEPHQPELPERVIVLDQGVRTWGSVRLALAAAAFSLLAPKAKRCASIELFVTSVNGAIDITGQNADAVADLLEASDLSPEPNTCLLRALREKADATPRDVILLTHPRTVRDLVRHTGQLLPPNDRLFALAVDERGRAELHEWINGSATAIRTFRVDLAAAEAARAEEELSQPRVFGAVGEWSGDVEPMPFPFRVGLVADPQSFGFDADGEWCVIAGANGVLHGLAFDGSPVEVLPRACRSDLPLRQVDAILGVNGGVVVCGRMAAERTPDSEKMQQVAAHYDRASRTVKLHWLGPALFNARWFAYPDLHCVAVRAETVTGCALDLGTGGRYPALSVSSTDLVSRARIAWDRSAKGSMPPQTVPVLKESPPPGPIWGSPFLLGTTDGVVILRQLPIPWPPFVPECEGKPLFAGAELHRVQLAGNVLAVSFTRSGERKIVLVHGPNSAVLGEVTHPVRNPFTLSADGRFLARRDATRSVIVSATNDVSRPLATASHAALHNALDIRLDAEPFRLTIAIGTFAHTFRVQSGELRYSLALGWDNAPEPKVPLNAQKRAFAPTDYDAGRFPGTEAAASGSWRAVLDRLGQVLLFARQELVAVFLVRRERAAAWLPDGVFWGSPAIIGGAATPDAEKRFGRAIESAGASDRGTWEF